MSLSDLEAFAAGCKVIASMHGSTHEVLGDKVRYVDPCSVEQIRTVLFDELAKDAPRSTNARGSLIEQYQWENLGRTLVQIYKDEIRTKT